MEDILMDKKYYWIIDGKYYEVTKKQYQKFKKEYDHSKMLEEYEEEVVILSLDAMTSSDHPLGDIISDPDVNVEELAIHRILLQQMRNARSELDAEEQLLIELIFDQEKSQDEASAETGIPQSTISYRLEKALEKMRKKMGIKKISKK